MNPRSKLTGPTIISGAQDTAAHRFLGIQIP